MQLEFELLRKYHYIVSESKNIIVEWDRRTDTAVFSGKWTERFGYPAVINDFTRWLETLPILSEQTRKKLIRQLADPAAQSSETELEVTTPSGETQWFLLHFSFQKNPGGHIVSGIGYLSDISSQKQEILSLQSEVMADSLTGLLNRRAIHNYMNVHLRLPGEQTMTAMFIIDLDNFKHINDTYGHPCGDYVLVRFSGFLKNMFRKTDAIGRLGGDEFIILMYARPNEQLITRKAGKMTEKPFTVQWNGQDITVSFSMGIAVSFHSQADYDLLYRSADNALYQAKQHCKGSFFIHMADRSETE